MHSENVMRDPSEVQAAMERNLIVFCWGENNNDQEAIKFLKKVGLHGIIYDKQVEILLVIQLSPRAPSLPSNKFSPSSV